MIVFILFIVLMVLVAVLEIILKARYLRQQEEKQQGRINRNW